MGGCCGEPKYGGGDGQNSNRPTSQYQASPYIVQQQPPPIQPLSTYAPDSRTAFAPAQTWTPAPSGSTPSPTPYGTGQLQAPGPMQQQLYAVGSQGQVLSPSSYPILPAAPQPAVINRSPPPHMAPPSVSGSSVTSPTLQRAPSLQANDEGKLVISIDFVLAGTTFSGVAYGSSRIAGGKVQQILRWPKAMDTFRKVPTCLLYDEQGRVLAWGLEAKHATIVQGMYRCEWFKLYLEPQALREGGSVDPRLPPLPPGKTPFDLIVDYLSCLWEYSREQITRDISSVADLDTAQVWLTVPAAWNQKACAMMRDAAIRAQLVRSAHAHDRNWRSRLKIITEPEAAAVHAAALTNLHNLRGGQSFMICDAGGGTVDLAVYRLLGQSANVESLEIAEVGVRSGSNCGSIFLDMRFGDLVRTLLARHPAHLDGASLAYFMHAFSETEKLSFRGEEDDGAFFRFNCFNPDDGDDPNVGLENGELSIPGNLLRTQIFDPVVQDVIALIDDALSRTDEPVDAIVLVGGFSACEYLLKRVQAKFSPRVPIIARPTDADTATCRGAAEYGLSRRELVSSIVVPRAYVMKVKLPAEQEDYQKRPNFIINNAAGAAVCENRLQYLVTKGAVLPKGSLVRRQFCKFSQNVSDRQFVAVLYTSESNETFRYTDDGDVVELCKWTVDLGSLPTFQQQAQLSNGQGFYTNFELGLSIDSAGKFWIGRVPYAYKC
ncbi:hypothetical protein EXIGLDRAFT_693266 [Exidia glandulosa HHB12029]|uniref:Actin-like ATPase domain-containing protein n=1 Tax=Exidia glandulosa HHB12029 TaxID=1314781 RepID=A0A165HEN5_EXIGL|nr:hypothetical protein EXIGLDRAFT_693266 [Exidia glandulosa HHB12029]